MKVLFIGNSFSADLTRYMQDISGGELFVRNLYIGGCSLEMHAKNLKSGAAAYESTSEHPDFVRYGSDSAVMFEKITGAVKEITQKYSLPVIPSGDAVEAARKMPEFSNEGGTMAITRDGFHMNIPYGRYLVGLVANKLFTGKSTMAVEYIPEDADGELCEKLRAVADTII